MQLNTQDLLKRIGRIRKEIDEIEKLLKGTTKLEARKVADLRECCSELEALTNGAVEVKP